MERWYPRWNKDGALRCLMNRSPLETSCFCLSMFQAPIESIWEAFMAAALPALHQRCWRHNQDPPTWFQFKVSIVFLFLLFVYLFLFLRSISENFATVFPIPSPPPARLRLNVKTGNEPCLWLMALGGVASIVSVAGGKMERVKESFHKTPCCRCNVANWLNQSQWQFIHPSGIVSFLI